MQYPLPSVAGVNCHARPLPISRLPRAVAVVAALLLVFLQVQALLAEDQHTAVAQQRQLTCPATAIAHTGSFVPAARHCIAG